MYTALMGLTVLCTLQRESVWCKLLRALQVLPLSHCGKLRRNSALRIMRKGYICISLNLGGTTKAFVPLAAGLFLFIGINFLSKEIILYAVDWIK